MSFLNFAILTGVLRIAKESIFSGLDNLDVYSVMDEEYSSVMGFTTAEVEKMAGDLQADALLPRLKAWYDGYRFGHHEIYNPWSVISCFAKRRYWRLHGSISPAKLKSLRPCCRAPLKAGRTIISFVARKNCVGCYSRRADLSGYTHG